MKITRLPSTIEQRNKKVAAYARVSTLYEDQDGSYSTQCDYYKQLIKNTPGWDFAGIYADHGKSGLVAEKRPDFLRMVEDCKKGLIDIILVKSISRFGRNYREVQEYSHLLKEYNVEIRYEREKISSMDPSSELVLNFLLAVSEEESKSISENVKVSLNWNAAKGIRHVGNNRIYGYNEVDGELVPNSETSWIPKLVFEEYVAGIMPGDIAKHLDEKGAMHMREKCKGQPFNVTNIYSILKNEVYMGDRIIQKNPPINYKTKRIDKTADYQQYYVRNHHEPIVSKELWDKAQERMKQEAELRSDRKVRKQNCSHWLYGRVFCGECGEPMLRKSIKVKGEMQKVWKCRDRIQGSKGNGCKCDVITEADLFYLICMQTRIKWPGIENITEMTFEKVAEVKVFDGRRIEVLMK